MQRNQTRGSKTRGSQLPGAQQPCFPEAGRQDGCFPDAPAVPRDIVCWAVETIEGIGAGRDADQRPDGRKGGKRRGGAGRPHRRG